MADDPRSTRPHPDPARPDDPLIPNPGDPYPGHPDPAYPSADHPAQQQSGTSGEAVRRQMVSGEGGAEIQPPEAPPPRQQGAPAGGETSPDRQRQPQQSHAPSAAREPSPLGDPSPGDENPRPLPPKGSRRRRS